MSKYDLAQLEAARGGDKAAILALLVAAQPDIRRYAHRSCGRADDVDDVVQETLWLLYRRVGTLRAVTSLSGWLLAIVRRECLRMASRVMGKTVEIDEALQDPAIAARLATLPPHDLRIDVARAIEPRNSSWPLLPIIFTNEIKHL